MALFQRLRTALPNARVLSQATRAAFASDAETGSSADPASPPPRSQQEAEPPASGEHSPTHAGVETAAPATAGVSGRTTPLPPRRSTRLSDSIGVDLGLVGVEDKDARRLARMQQSRARRDTGQRRDGLGDGSRPLQREGGEPPRHFQPPRDDRPPSRPYQPPREFQPPRDPQYQRRRPRPPMRDQDGGRLGPRIGASAEPQMPRLASPRWSGQGRILGRPDVKPPGDEPPLRRDEPPPDEDEAPLSSPARQQRSRGLAARSSAAGAGSQPAPRGRADLMASQDDDAQQQYRQTRGRGRTGRAGGAMGQRSSAMEGGDMRGMRRPPGDGIQRGRRRDDYAGDEEDMRPAMLSGNEEPRTLRELENQIHRVYGWDDETVRETDRELAHLAAAEQDAHAAAAADGDLEDEYEDEADVGEPEVVPVYDDHAASDFEHAFHSELDPRMTLHVGLAPPKRGQQPSPEEFLDAMKGQLMEGMRLTEEEWEQHAAEALEGFDEARAALVPPPIPDVEAELDELVHSQMPQDHPCYGHVASSLDMVKGNPFWTLPQKQAYLQRLVRDMRSAV